MQRIAILTHPDQDVDTYLIALLARCWVRDGLEVVVLTDPSSSVEADLAILHVDLTQVPAAWIAWCRRFPRVVNGRVTCTAKRAVSRQLVARGDGYEGPVIVKSDRNYGGRPEALLERRALRREAGRLRRLLGGLLRTDALRPWRRVRAPLDPYAYPVLPAARDVPDDVWADERLVVERFCAERDGAFYCLRKLWCCGDRSFHVKARARHPVVKAARIVAREAAVPPPELDAWRAAFGFEFGKVDYVCPAGAPVVLDVNPTPGIGRAYLQSATDVAERLAPGIHAMLRADGTR